MINYQTSTANRLLATHVLEAKAYCEQWLQDFPNSFEALHFCGLISAKLKDMVKALDYFTRAILLNPSNVSCHNNLSNVYLSLDDTEKALQHLHQALRLDPLHPEAYNNLGRLLYKQGRISDAIPHFQKALRMEPDYWEAHYNLAHSLASQNQMSAAATHYREVLRLMPEHNIAHFNLGLACLSEDNFTEAEKHLRKALELSPNNLEAAKQLGFVSVTLGKIPEAIQAFNQSLAISPDLAEVHHNLAVLHLRNQAHAPALFHFEEALRLEPTNDTAKHMVTALNGASTPSAAPIQYVAQLFDQYADYYDEHVKHKLKYAVPGLLRNAVGLSVAKQSNPKVGRVLDIGCGTGLCGIFFRDLALELIGIDLSKNMIEKAKALNTYEKLLAMDLNDYLAQTNLEPFDLVIAGDVFVYTGDLETIFKKIKNILHPNGRFAFTTEYIEENHLMMRINNETSSGFCLQTSGRYAHTRSYIQRLANQFGFTIELEESIVPREHEGEPIRGYLYVLGS